MSNIALVKTIVLAPSAARALDKLDGTARERITDALHAYAIHGTGDTKAMVGTPTVRLRTGNFRVIFDETATTIHVLALGDRRDIYR
jgi:mRNA interferase RelE/StbE